MTITEIEEKIQKSRIRLAETRNAVNKAFSELTELNAIKESKIKEAFDEFLELGSTFRFTSYANLNGVQTGYKKTDRFSFSPNFRVDEVIEFIKKNKKSFVVKCTKNVTYKTGESGTKEVTFRIDSDSLYQHMTRDKDFYDRLMSYIKRKDSLEQLLG